MVEDEGEMTIFYQTRADSALFVLAGPEDCPQITKLRNCVVRGVLPGSALRYDGPMEPVWDD